MTSSSSPKSSRLKVREHRERLRRQGLRPIQIWVPDVRSPEFRAEAHRQSLIVATGAGEEENQAFVDAISDWSEEGSEAKSGLLPVGKTTQASHAPRSFFKTTPSTSRRRSRFARSPRSPTKRRCFACSSSLTNRMGCVRLPA